MPNRFDELQLTAVIEPAVDGGFTCFFAEMPEVFSEGETVAEAEANLYDALREMLACQRERSLAQHQGAHLATERFARLVA